MAKWLVTAVDSRQLQLSPSVASHMDPREDENWPGSSAFEDEDSDANRSPPQEDIIDEEEDTLETNYYAVLGVSRMVCSLSSFA